MVFSTPSRRVYGKTVSAGVFKKTGVPAFTPASISGLKLWFDANDPATLFQDDALITPAVNDADPIGGWKDKAGGGYHALQSNAGSRPALDLAATPSGKQGVLFDGSTDKMLTSLAGTALTSGGAGSLFAVVRTDSWSSSPSGRFACGSFNTNPDRWFLGAKLESPTRAPIYGVYNRSSASSPAFVGVTTMATASFYVLGFVVPGSGVACQGYLSNSQEDEETCTGATGSAVFVIGEVATGFWKGHICEILAYTKALSTTEQTNLYNYLKAKWGTV